MDYGAYVQQLADEMQPEVALKSAELELTPPPPDLKLLADPKRLRSAPSSEGHDPEASPIVAPMPGKVVRVLVGVGSRVEAGAGVVVVEAMKMQNEMKAPRAGKVLSMSAKAGATVAAGEILATIG